ncbi:MAG: hypothetical protein ACAH88_20425 [Roseimicrobium sp.]
MEPFSKDDPLHKLLGKGRAVEPRPNFTQNVLRAVRQEPQKLGFWEQCRVWLGENGGAKTLCRGVVAAAAVVTFSLVIWQKAGSPSGNSVNVVSAPGVSKASVEMDAATAEMPVEAVASELDTLDHLSVMLALQDTSALTDSDIASFLY